MATTNPTPSAPAHRRAIIRSLAAVLLFAAVNVVGTASPARADCAPLDLQCLAQEVLDPVTETVEEVIAPVTETVEEVVDPVTETVEGVLDPVTETIDEVISPILDPVEEVLDPVLDPVEDVIPPIPGGTGDQPAGAGETDTPPPGAPVPVPDGTDPPMSRTAPAPGDPSNDGVGVPDVLGASSSPLSGLGGLPVTGGAPVGPASSADVVELTVPSGVRPPGSMLGFSGGAEAAKRLAFPLLLVVLAFVFVVMENRLDRRDPKLTVAARVPEVVTFG